MRGYLQTKFERNHCQTTAAGFTFQAADSDGAASPNFDPAIGFASKSTG